MVPLVGIICESIFHLFFFSLSFNNNYNVIDCVIAIFDQMFYHELSFYFIGEFHSLSCIIGMCLAVLITYNSDCKANILSCGKIAHDNV